MPYPDSPPTEIWSWNFNAPGWDKDVPSQLLADAALMDREKPPGSRSTFDVATFEWGASNQVQTILNSLRAVEDEPSLLGLGPHILAVARKP